jgi:hypothetical protein
MDINRNIQRSAFYTPSVSDHSDNKINVDRNSPTATHEFPPTPTISNRTVDNGSVIKNNSYESQNLPPTAAAAEAFENAPSRAIGHVPMDFYEASSAGNQGKKEDAEWTSRSANYLKDLPIAATVNKVETARVPKPVSSATDEKTRARQARMVAMAQQQQHQMQMAKTATSNSRHVTPGNSPVVAPPHRDLNEDPNVLASISEHTARKLEPPLRMTALTSRTTTASSISTTSSGSTEVTYNTTGWTPPKLSSAASVARNMAVSLVLDEDYGDVTNGHATSLRTVNKPGATDAADLEVQKRAAHSAQKDIPSRHGFNEDPDVLAKRQGRASSITEHNGSSKVTHLSTGWALPTFSSAASMARNMAISLVLEDDEDLAEGTGAMDAADLEVKKRAARPAQQAIPRRHTTHGVVDADTAVKRNAHMTPEEMMRRGAVARRRSTATSTANFADSMSSQHSNASSVSSVGAHSVTGGRRAAKKSDSNTDDDDDAVGQYLTSLARSQVTGLKFVPEDDDHFDDEDVKKPGAVAVSKDATKNAKLGSIGSRGFQKETVLSHIGIDENQRNEDDEFANAGSGDELDDEEEMQVAQAGVPVLHLQPGAFAVEGMNGHGSNDDFNEPFDSDLNRDDDWNREVSGDFSHLSHDPTLTDPNSALFFDEELAFGATLYNNDADSIDIHGTLHVVFEAQPLSEEPEKLSAKALRRLRMMQGGIFCLALAAFAAVVGVAASRPDQATSLHPWHQVPIIEGWNQVGTNLTGPTDDDKSLFGYAIAMAGNAERIAIGVPGRDQGVTELLVGEVQVLDWNGTDWLPNGFPIVGPGPNGQAGTAVAISNDGKRVAVGSPFLASGGGHVAVYEEDVSSKKWVIVGQVLFGNASDIASGDGRFGGSLALSDDGSTLAVGATMGENNQGGAENRGYVKVYQLQDVGVSRWVPIGDTIFGEAQGDFFGWSLAMSASGTRVVAGAVGSTGGRVGELSGQVRVFDYVEEADTWTQAGPSISGLAAFDSFGSSVAVSSKGDIIAVGAIGHSNADQGIDIGHVRVFHYVDSGTESTWEPLGQTLMGQSAFDSFGYSVSLSEDGKVVAAGGPRNDEFSESSGHIQVFELTGEGSTAAWARRRSSIGGSYDSPELFGWSVALSSNGSRVAGGAPFSTFDGRLNDVGAVRIYDVA